MATCGLEPLPSCSSVWLKLKAEEKQLNSDEDDDISTINDKDSNNSTEASKDEKDKTETHDGSFLGYCYPNPNELEIA